MSSTEARTTAAVLCAALVVIGLGGCASSTNTGSAGTLTVAQFKAQANAICKAGNADIKQLGSTITTSSSAAAVVAVLHQAANRANREVADIGRLAVPSSLAADVNGWRDAMNIATAKILKGGIEVLSGADPFTDADTRAKALGLGRCESGSGT